MNIITTTVGSYPRLGEPSGMQVLRRTIQKWQEGKQSAAELTAATDFMTALAIAEQEATGVQLVTDGQIRGADSISRQLEGIAGVEIGGIIRFYDSNYLVRRPVVKRKIGTEAPLKLLGDYEFARRHALTPVKPVVQGPFTLAQYSVRTTGHYKSVRALAEVYTDLVSQEIKALAKTGAPLIQVDEPNLVVHPDGLKWYHAIAKKLMASSGKTKLALYTYFGNATAVFDSLLALPFPILGVDLTYSPELVQKIGRKGIRKSLALGIVDGRNTRMEDPTTLARRVGPIVSKFDGETLYLNPSCGLEYLGRSHAREKLRRLVVTANLLRGSK